MKVKFWKWILGFGVVGLLVPPALMLHANLTRTLFGDRELLLWPGSIALLSTEGMPRTQAYAVFAESLCSNVLFYAALGALAWPLRCFLSDRWSVRADMSGPSQFSMIETEPRKQAAELVEKFRDGAITNDQFVNAWPRSKKEDRALNAIYSMLWISYSDIRTHKLNLTPEWRGIYDRCALFLRSDHEYKWQRDSFGTVAPIAFITRLLNHGKVQELTESHIVGPDAIWPFFSGEELKQQRDRTQASK